MAKLTPKYALDRAKGMVEEYKSHWDRLYKGQLLDYRRMAAGRLPLEIHDNLSKPEYEYRSKLVPRLIPDSIAELKGRLIHNLFGSGEPFEVVGVTRDDQYNAENVNLVVKYGWEMTSAKMVCAEIIQDAIEVGIGFGEVVHTDEYVNAVRGGGLGVVEPSLGRELRYSGPKLHYLRPETTYLEPVRRPENLSAYAKLMLVPISSIYREASEGGIYYKFRDNVKKIRKSGLRSDPLSEYDVYCDHSIQSDEQTPDFKVLIAEVWAKLSDSLYKPGEWHVITIANYDSNPVLIRFDRDPLGTGNHPLVICRVFPQSNMMLGDSAVNKLFDLMLEKFNKRNQRINYANQVINFASMIIAPAGAVKKDSIAFKTHKIIEMLGASAKDLSTIHMDVSPITTSLQEEHVIDLEAQRTMATNEILAGRNPLRYEAATTNSLIETNAKVLQSLPLSAVEETLIKPVVRRYVVDFQLFSDPYFVIRVTGKKGVPTFTEVDRASILGSFDVVCHASSTVIPRVLRQAMFSQFVQIYGANPRVNIDWNAFAKKHMEVMEMPISDDIIRQDAWVESEIRREEAVMLNGLPWEPLEHEPHQRHLAHHLETLSELTEDAPGFTALRQHVYFHKQFEAQIQGQLNLPSPTGIDSVGDVLNDVSGRGAPEISDGSIGI
jgi:hypothetical protein